MNVVKLIQQSDKTGFSFEILPPLKGSSINRSFKTIETLKEFKPLYINITTHRSEMVYKTTSDGLYQRVSERNRPGTVAVAAAIQHKFNIPAVPHLICSGFSKTETEYALIDLNFLGIENLLILRGDKAKHENCYVPSHDGYSHACELQQQVNLFNQGSFLDGTKMDIVNDSHFTYGVAGYPEKHDESPNMEEDLKWLKYKVDNGASYIVTQMFFDNSKYYDFVNRCRAIGINVPIIPGLKPIIRPNQVNVLPKIFHVDMPSELVAELVKCKDDEATKQVGVEWCKMQALDLIKHGVPSIHFYSLMAVESVYKVAQQIY